MSKVIADARSAVADLPEGATLLVGGFGLCGIPEELIEAVRDLGRDGTHRRQQQRRHDPLRAGPAAAQQPGAQGDGELRG